MQKFQVKKFAETEIELAKGILEKFPFDVLQSKRLLQWAVTLNKPELIEQYATTDELKEFVEGIKNG